MLITERIVGWPSIGRKKNVEKWTPKNIDGRNAERRNIERKNAEWRNIERKNAEKRNVEKSILKKKMSEN